MRIGLLLSVILVGSLAPAHSARAQGGNGELEQVIGRLASAWSRGDAAGVVALVTRSGLSLDLGSEVVGPLNPRQATAVLRGYFEEHETVELQHTGGRVVSGAPGRAFAELNWVRRVRGTTIPARTTVVLQLVIEDRDWRISQIRLLP
jgi:hypothetical protein